MKTWRLPALHTKLTWLMSLLTGTDTENEPVCGFCGFSSSSSTCLMNHTVTLRTCLDHQANEMQCTQTHWIYSLSLSLLCSICQSDNTHYELKLRSTDLWFSLFFLFTPVLSRSPSIGREVRQTGSMSMNDAHWPHLFLLDCSPFSSFLDFLPSPSLPI